MFEKFKNFLTKPSTKNVLRAALTMFVVGVALAAVAMPIAYGLGAVGILEAAFAADVVAKTTFSSVAWTGVFFGMFGGIQAAVTPMIEKFFKPKPSTVALSYFTEMGHAANIAPTLPSPSTAQNVSPTHFQDIVAASKVASALSPGGKPVG